LHAFGDASGKGVAAVVYAVVNQPSGTTQGLVAAKERLAKHRLTMARVGLCTHGVQPRRQRATNPGWISCARNVWLARQYSGATLDKGLGGA
jgi:hypothetical protein